VDARYHYRIFDLQLSSGIALPELEAIEDGASALNTNRLNFDLHAKPRAAETELDWFHDWELDDGEICLSGAYYKGGHLLRFPELADFAISADGQHIDACAVADTPAETIRHILIDQVIPRLVSHRGNLVVHGSANAMVEGGGDLAVAFLGDTGYGKSTMAVSMQERGFPLLGDDCLALRCAAGDSLELTASYRGARLLDDSIAELAAGGGPTAPVAHYSGKARIALPLAHSTRQAWPLQAIFLLNSPVNAPREHGVVIEPVGGADALIAMMRNSFQLDITDREHVVKQFTGFGRDILSRLPIYSLSYPRRYTCLDEVCEAVLATLAGQDNYRNPSCKV
jgi:hypothetical protein